MKSFKASVLIIVAAIVAACVTINVYFPEAAAEEAADRFIEDVIGPDDAEADVGEPGDALGAFSFNPLDWIFPAAHAQANLDINTPAIRAIQVRMEQRYASELAAHFASGVIGLTSDALVAVRDLGAVPLAQRNKVKAAVKAENDDRNAVYREIAVANGHPEWEAQIRATFAARWIANARPGWYYQNDAGAWVQK